jgi:hypothetical protein
MRVWIYGRLVVCNWCLQYLLIFCTLNVHGMCNVWLCVVYEILLYWLASSVTNLWDIIKRKVFGKYVKSVLQYTFPFFYHEKVPSDPTSYLIMYCHESVCVHVRACVCVCVCGGVNSCVIKRHLECDCMQWGVFVTMFHTDVMQAAGSCTI